MDLTIGMTREGLRALAAKINAACDDHSDDEGISVGIVAEYNGTMPTGPRLTIDLNNDDMEGEHVPSPATAYWEYA